MALNLEVNILGDYKKLTKATKGAEKNLSKFGKSGASMSKKLGRAFAGLGAAFGAAKIGHFIMDSAKAAGEDMRAQKLLAMTLERNTGAKAKDVKATEDMIGRMEMATGIADDELRPAMGKLAAATGDVNKAQGLLKIALGVSAKYGKPLDTVTQALSKAFNGNTTSLTKMIPQLKNSKDVLGDLKKDVKGFAEENADPFQRLQRGIDQFKEMIGAPIAKGFADLMDRISTPGSPEAQAVQELSTAFTDFGTSMNTFFSQFDSDKTSGFVGFVQVLKNFATVSGALMEVGPAAVALGNGKMLDPAKFPNISSITQTDLKRSLSGWENNTMGAKTKGNPSTTRLGGFAFRGIGARSNSAAPAQVFNVTIKPTTSMTPDETVKMIRAWEKKHGVKYSGPVR